MGRQTTTSTPQLETQDADLQSKTRIVVADDHEIVREGIRRILNRMRPEWEICGEATTGNQSVELVKALKPGIAVLDITMPGMNGLEAARRITKLDLGCRILIFTVHDSDWLKTEIRDSGAHGYLHKSQVARDLVSAIESLLAGGTFFREESEPPSYPGSLGPLG